MSAQAPDIVFLRNVKMELYSNPLEQYWMRLPKKRPQFLSTSDCKRGYVATWVIKGRELFLTAVNARVARKFLWFTLKWRPYKLGEFSPDVRNGMIKAHWFSGKLRIPRGKMTLYQHKDYESRFEREIIISVDRGNVQKVVTLDNEHQTLTVNTTFPSGNQVVENGRGQ